MSVAEKLTTIAENQQKVFDAGNKSEYDRFWDVFQEKGDRAIYTYAFAYSGWNDETYNPKYTIRPTACNNMFAFNTVLTDTKIPIDLTGPGNQKFALFNGASKLKTIHKLIVNEVTNFNPSGASTMFQGCNALENITIEGTIGKNVDFQYSTFLTRESINNVISCLSDDVTGQTLTLSATAVNNAFTADEWNALISDKTNWTFSLV